MAKRYAIQQVGVIDGTSTPPKRADARQVNAKKRLIVASKQVLADAAGDTISLGKVPANAMITKIELLTDTSFGATATIAVGIAGASGKYVAARTFTVTDVPTVIGPKASTVAAGPLAAEEEIIVTVAAAALPVGAVAHFIIEYVTNN